MIKKENNDYYRIFYKEREFEFEFLKVQDSSHMRVVGSEEKIKELHVRFIKPANIVDEEYYPILFDALKENLRNKQVERNFGKKVLEIVFRFNQGVLIHFFVNNIRAEIGNRVVETAFFVKGEQIYKELDRLLLKLSENQNDLWICSEFNLNEE